MNNFELFTMIYFWLDNYYYDETNSSISNQISEMNPFLWDDIGSADPAVYHDFCTFIAGREITIGNSLDIAREYIKTIDHVDMSEAFDIIDNEKWMNACEEYLAEEHKGASE